MLHDIDGFLHVETDMAILFSEDGDKDSAVWLPKSQIEYSEKGRGRCEVTLPEWLAVDKGLL